MIDIVEPILADISKVGDLAYQYYRSDVKVSIKNDKTIVTNVDKMIHDEVSKSLQHFFPHIPIISEEGVIPSTRERQGMDEYWLLDPLDGTLEFVEETDEFVISLGLIKKQQPVMGVLHHPVSGKTWVSIKNRGVFIQQHGGNIVPIQPTINHDTYSILVSAHRHDELLSKAIVRQRKRELNRPVAIKPLGSALKFAYLAEGIGDEYLRFTPLKEWDFAAGHSIALESGFEVTPLDKSDTVAYGTNDMLIPPLSIRKKQ